MLNSRDHIRYGSSEGTSVDVNTTFPLSRVVCFPATISQHSPHARMALRSGLAQAWTVQIKLERALRSKLKPPLKMYVMQTTLTAHYLFPSTRMMLGMRRAGTRRLFGKDYQGRVVMFSIILRLSCRLSLERSCWLLSMGPLTNIVVISCFIIIGAYVRPVAVLCIHLYRTRCLTLPFYNIWNEC